MCATVFLSKFLGFYLAIMGLFLIMRGDSLKSIIKGFSGNSSMMILAGSLNIVFGLVIVLMHSCWYDLETRIITAVGVISLVKGVLHLFAPGWTKPIAKKMASKSCPLYCGLVILAAGAYLLYNSFYIA